MINALEMFLPNRQQLQPIAGTFLRNMESFLWMAFFGPSTVSFSTQDVHEHKVNRLAVNTN